MTKVSESVWAAVRDVCRQPWGPRARHSVDLNSSQLRIDTGGRYEYTGALTGADRDALKVLLPIAAAPRPFAMAQLGQSLDGRIATASGDSHYINGRDLRAHLHRLRALVDAVVIGAGTAVADRPRLDVRLVEGPNPVPVVVDPRGRVPMAGPLFDAGRAPRRVLHLVECGLELASAPAHVERVELERGANGFSPDAILATLKARGLERVLIEGGGETVSRFLGADALARLHLLIAPLLIGSGRPGLVLEPIERLAEARRPAMQSIELGGELIVDVDLLPSAAG